MRKTEIRICGLGGQGVVLAGQILGRAAVHHGRNVAQTQSYGAEARGSAAKSETIISDSKIGFPLIRKCDVLVAMNQNAAEKNLKDLKEDGILIIDNSLVKSISETKAKAYGVPATETAEKTIGERIYGNIVILGATTRITKIVDEADMAAAIRETFPEKALEKNMKAYKAGVQLAASAMEQQ